MSTETGIGWTDSTFNPWMGCTAVSPACDHCYAQTLVEGRFKRAEWGPGKPRVRTSPTNWKLPLQWEREHEAFYREHGRNRRVFCASLADVFDNEVDPAWRADLFRLIAATPHLTWQLLTKRIGNAAKMIFEAHADAVFNHSAPAWPWANVWIGATICNQQEADRDIPKLLAVPAAKRFLSIEPMLGAIDLTDVREAIGTRGRVCHLNTIEAKNANPAHAELVAAFGPDYPYERIDWVIAGGESGNHARPSHPDWLRSLRDQCAAAGVPFFFKQWGEWKPICEMRELEHQALYRSRVLAKPHEDQANIDDIYGRDCTVQLTIIHADGSLHDAAEPMAFRQEKDAMATFRIGTKASGNLLDGVKHEEFPA